jgi:hypothetical protein
LKLTRELARHRHSPRDRHCHTYRFRSVNSNPSTFLVSVKHSIHDVRK